MSEAQQVAAAEEVQSGDAQVETTEATAEASAEAPAQVDKSAEDRAWQSRYDRLQQTVSKELLGYVNQYGGGQNIVGILKQFESALGNPTLGPLVQSFLKTGQVELPKPKSEWEEPVQEDPWKPQFNSLLAELQSVKQSLTDMQRSQGMNAISEHTKKFLAEYPMDEREKQQFSDFMDTQWATLTASPQGTQLLKNIDYGSFKRLALPGIEDSLESIIARKREKTRGQVAQRATDAPGRSTNGQERAAPTVPANTQQFTQSVREAFRRAMSSAA